MPLITIKYFHKEHSRNASPEDIWSL